MTSITVIGAENVEASGPDAAETVKDHQIGQLAGMEPARGGRRLAALQLTGEGSLPHQLPKRALLCDR
ncbi:hypothetical protein [Streptomyces sp. 142MFCol3.1]|uniref:hypothetical protein n=1 Tax=Streptomyces sp. 142MFCol3.1 TaxID=1172179 RepID=UPI000426B800|nr:hypothetical protein [Streptomyces sp. 142MFCol3.1]